MQRARPAFRGGALERAFQLRDQRSGGGHASLRHRRKEKKNQFRKDYPDPPAGQEVGPESE
jgi:hypothetical protein